MSSLLKDPPPLTKPAPNKNGALPFNKMFIMIPVMLAARNLKNDDLNTVYMIRVAYVVVQTICLLLAVYTYIIISSIQGNSTVSTGLNRIIYVPAPPQVSCRELQAKFVVHFLSIKFIFTFVSVTAIRRSKYDQEEIYRTQVIIPLIIASPIIIGKYSVRYRNDVRLALLQRHDNGIGHTSRDGTL